MFTIKKKNRKAVSGLRFFRSYILQEGKMNSSFQDYCERFVNNRNVLAKAFAFNRDIMNMTSSLILTENGLEVDPDDIKRCEKIIQKETSILSDFRGNVRIPLASKMLASGDPEGYFKRVSDVYKLLKDKKWSGNEYKVLAAMILADHVEECDYARYVDLTIEIFSRMNKEHRILTGSEDLPFAAIMATSDVGTDKLISDMEACYAILVKKFHDNNAVQSLCQVLSMSDRTPEDKCDRVIGLYEALKKAKHKFGTGQELATLGTLALLDRSVDEIVTLVGEADIMLKQYRGFGNFTLGSRYRRLYAAQLCANHLVPDTEGSSDTVISSTLALAIAMEVCAIICICACVAVTTSSH